MEIGARIRAAREASGMTQEEVCAKSGIPISSYRKYEKGTGPGADAVAGLVLAGMNANYLMTGNGPMLLKDLPPIVSDQAGEYRVSAAAPAPAIDMARLQLAIATVEEALEQTHRTATPDRKAELVAAVYDLYQEPSTSRERVLKLVKLAA